MLKEIKSNTEGVEWFDEYEDVIGVFPNENYHPLTKKEWTEIEEALNVLNHNTALNRESYIQRFKGNELAIKVKLSDLRHNMDLSRIPSPTEKDYARLERYKSEFSSNRVIVYGNLSEKVEKMFSMIKDMFRGKVSQKLF